MRSPRIGFIGRRRSPKLFIIGIAAGNREHVAVQPVKALNAPDVFLAVDKGEEEAEPNRIRQEIRAATQA